MVTVYIVKEYECRNCPLKNKILFRRKRLYVRSTSDPYFKKETQILLNLTCIKRNKTTLNTGIYYEIRTFICLAGFLIFYD